VFTDAMMEGGRETLSERERREREVAEKAHKLLNSLLLIHFPNRFI